MDRNEMICSNANPKSTDEQLYSSPHMYLPSKNKENGECTFGKGKF